MAISVSEVLEVVEGVKKQVTPKYIQECSRNHTFPEKLWNVAADLGLMGIGVPEKLGGAGGGVTELVALTEALCRAGLELPQLLMLGFVRQSIIEHGTEAQRRKYVEPTINGKLRLCFAITEPNAGTNTFKMQTLARQTPEGSYRLNGQKTFISGFEGADYCLLVARTTPYKEVTDRRQGISLFILDTKAKGISKTRLDIGLDMAESQWTLYFDDVEIPAENRIGEEGKGIKYLFSTLNPERMIVAATSLGGGDYVLGKAVEYAKQRAPFDTPIGAYQGIQHPLAYAKAHLEAARCMLYKACAMYDAGQDCGAYANMAKLLASDAGMEAVNIALQTFGGSGVDHETGIIRHFAVMKLKQIAPISNQMVLNHIGEHVLGLPKSY